MAIDPQQLQSHIDSHLVNRSNWLRAAILGANDGILSTASILTGMAAAGSPHNVILLAGIAGLVAGATSMATGEYVSVSSQSDIEKADLKREKHALTRHPAYEQEELAQIYVTRGLETELAREVSKQLMEHDALGAHARDELGISEITTPRPIQAAVASATSFTTGAALPLVVMASSPTGFIVITVTVTSLISLALLGAIGAKISGVALWRPMLRVLLWGSVSMGLAAGTGHIFGVSPG